MWKTEKNLPFTSALIFFVSILILSQIFTPSVRIKILNIFRVPLKLISGAHYALRDISNFREVIRENKILKENTENLKKEIVGLREDRLENERLRKLLGFREAKKRGFIPAMVIARDPTGLGETIIIDKGKRQDVEKDMVVISGDGLVGRVRETGWSIARVLLITDPDSVIGAIVQRSRDGGAVTGNARSGLLMKYLDLGCDVKEGDKVITSGFSSVYEKAILIGEVKSVYKDASGLYMNATLEPEVEIMKLEEVLVIR